MPHLSREVSLVAGLLALGALAAAPGKGSTAPLVRTFTAWDRPIPAAPQPSRELLEQGERVYRGACLGCHGEAGDGQGREGLLLAIPPRDFTQAQFVARSTPSGSLPLDEDLFRSIRRGFRPEVGMPGFDFLSDREVHAVIAFLKTFSTRWKEEPAVAPIPIGQPPSCSAQLVAEGEKAYASIGCGSCHGTTGRGDGKSAKRLKYDTGKPIRAADFTKPHDFKAGDRLIDVFRTITTGMDGTPMPTFAESLTDEQRWMVACWVQAQGAAARAAQKSSP